MNRIISLSVEDMYIKYTGEAFGATGSHNAVTLRMTFGLAWEGTAKTAYFTDALGNTSVALVLGLDTLVDGAYEVDVPSEALKTAGVATITIKGVLVSGETTTKAITTAAGHFRVLDSELPDSAGNAGTITPSDKEQLQAEIAGMETLFTTAKAAAETAAANAKVSETNAKASETAAASSVSSAEASKTAAADSAAAAAASANTAGSAAAAAIENASHAAESAKAAENTAGSIVTEETDRQTAEKVRQANETARQNAENARQTAETNRTQAETARNVWEDYDSAKGYQPRNKVYWQGSSYVCLKACTGISPENGTYWQLVVRSGFASDSAFGFDVVNGRLLCYYSGDNPPPFRLGDDGHLYVDLDKTYDLGKVTGGSGGGVDIDLGMTGATVGQIAKISAVDENGKPTKWEPVDLLGGGSGEMWEKIAEIELRTDTAEYVLADFATWRKAKVLMTRPKYISGLNKNVWCRVVGQNDTYPCGFFTIGYGFVFWEFSAEVNDLFIISSHIETNNRNSAESVKSTGTFMPLASPIETYKFKLIFVDTSVIQAGDKVTVIGVRR